MSGPATSWRHLLVIAANAAAAFQIGKVPGILGDLGDDLGIGLVQLGWIFSLSSVVAAGTAFLVPALVRRTGPRRLVVVGLGCLVLGSVVGGFAPDAAWLVAARVSDSAGLLLVGVGGPALLVASASRSVGTSLMGFWPAAVPAGTAAAMVATPALGEVAGWRVVWLVGGAVALLALLAMSAAPHDGHRASSGWPTAREVVRPLRELGSAVTICLGLVSACYSLLWLGVLGLLPIWFTDQMGFSVVTATALTGLAFLTNAVVTLTAGALQHRGIAGGVLIATAGLVFLPSVWLIYAAQLPLPIAAAVACLFSGSGGLLASANMRAIARHSVDAQEAGDRVAVVVQCTNIGQLTGPPLVALVVGTGRGAAVAATLTVPALIVIGCGLWLHALDARRACTAAPA
jgi:cyanate permease